MTSCISFLSKQSTNCLDNVYNVKGHTSFQSCDPKLFMVLQISSLHFRPI